MKKYLTFSEFWPFYVAEHSRRGTRILHFLGTTLFFIFLSKALFYQSLKDLIPAVALAYGCAWTGHFLIEKNRPATFQYPLFSLMGDFKMYWLMLRGRMKGEVLRAAALSEAS